MIFEERKYEAIEYGNLVEMLLKSETIDEELSYARRYVLRLNPKLFFLLFKAIEAKKEHEKINENSEEGISLGKLNEKLNEVEFKLSEHTNVIPADLPDSILFDSDLLKNYLADHRTITFKAEDWRSFQRYIEDKLKSIPKSFELVFLNWCKEMLNMNYKRHLKGCQNPTSCKENIGYDLRINYIERLIEDASPQLEDSDYESSLHFPKNLTNKIQWLGSQKELAELFVELKKKGWIFHAFIGGSNRFVFSWNSTQQRVDELINDIMEIVKWQK